MFTTIQELLSGILRFFPNSMIVSLAILGIATGRLPWILTSIGGIVVVILTLTVQYLISRTFGDIVAGAPAGVMMEACSLIPVAAGAGSSYTSLPSVWMATTSFFATFIFVNAVRLYVQVPSNGASKDLISVQQRKGMGLISMLAVLILFFALFIPRFMPRTCESTFGTLFGLAIGISCGYCWWRLLDACGSATYPDIHGVQSGLMPGALRTGPLACAPTHG